MTNQCIDIKIISQNDLIEAGCFNIATAIDVCEKAFVSFATDDVIFPEKVSVVFDHATQDRINCLPAAIKSEKIYGMKWVSVFPDNPHKYGKPNLTAVILLSELESGFPVAFMEGSLCSNLRTAAVGATAAKYLARKDSNVIGFIGAGEQAKTHLLSMLSALPELKVCKVSSHTTASEDKFIKQMKPLCPQLDFVTCNSDYKMSVQDCDVIVTAISGQEKILQADWVKEGAFYCHVAGLEDDFAVAKKADKIVCDNWSVVKHRTQTISQMYQQGLLTDSDIYADLHEIIIGDKPGRESDREFIYFNSVGMSFVDITLANWMYRKVLSAGLGTDFRLKARSMFER